VKWLTTLFFRYQHHCFLLVDDFRHLRLHSPRSSVRIGWIRCHQVSHNADLYPERTLILFTQLPFRLACNLDNRYFRSTKPPAPDLPVHVSIAPRCGSQLLDPGNLKGAYWAGTQQCLRGVSIGPDSFRSTGRLFRVPLRCVLLARRRTCSLHLFRRGESQSPAILCSPLMTLLAYRSSPSLSENKEWLGPSPPASSGLRSCLSPSHHCLLLSVRQELSAST
jgi:hypothetical protein